MKVDYNLGLLSSCFYQDFDLEPRETYSSFKSLLLLLFRLLLVCALMSQVVYKRDVCQGRLKIEEQDDDATTVDD